jgi:hypothetical protein
MPSTKTPPRFRFLAIGIWLSAIASHAFAQDAPEITLCLSPAQVAALVDAMDARGRLPVIVPPEWVQLADRLRGALGRDPAVNAEFEKSYLAIQRQAATP